MISELAGAVSAVALDPKGSVVVAGTEAGDLRVWGVSKADERHVLRESGTAVLELAVDPKGKRLAAGDANGETTIWDLKSGKLLATLPAADEGAVTGLVFVDKGDALAETWTSTQVTLWDLSDL